MSTLFTSCDTGTSACPSSSPTFLPTPSSPRHGKWTQASQNRLSETVLGNTQPRSTQQGHDLEKGGFNDLVWIRCLMSWTVPSWFEMRGSCYRLSHYWWGSLRFDLYIANLHHSMVFTDWLCVSISRTVVKWWSFVRFDPKSLKEVRNAPITSQVIIIRCCI